MLGLKYQIEADREARDVRRSEVVSFYPHTFRAVTQYIWQNVGKKVFISFRVIFSDTFG